jgi:hypothetical protein
MNIKIIKTVVLIVVFFFMLACREKVTRFYYDTGELQIERFDVGKDSAYYYYKGYYKNGQLKDKGHTLENNISQGPWMMFYSNGHLKWKGNYSNGYRVYKKVDYSKLEAIVSSNDPYISINKPFKFSIYIEGIHPEDYIVTKDIFGKVEVSDIYDDDYPYTLTLTKEEADSLCVKPTDPNASGDCLRIAVHLLPQVFNPDSAHNTYKFTSLPFCITRVPIKKE